MKQAVAAIIKQGDKILLCKRSLQAANQHGKWENAGGKVDGDETPEEAIVREIKEELGVDFVIEKRVYEDEFESEDDVYRVIIFSGSIVGVPKAMIEIETSEIEWFEISELKKVDLATYTRKDFERFGWI